MGKQYVKYCNQYERLCVSMLSLLLTFHYWTKQELQQGLNLDLCKKYLLILVFFPDWINTLKDKLIFYCVAIRFLHCGCYSCKYSETCKQNLGFVQKLKFLENAGLFTAFEKCLDL